MNNHLKQVEEVIQMAKEIVSTYPQGNVYNEKFEDNASAVSYSVIIFDKEDIVDMCLNIMCTKYGQLWPITFRTKNISLYETINIESVIYALNQELPKLKK